MRVLELLEEIEEIVDTDCRFSSDRKDHGRFSGASRNRAGNPCGASGRDPAGTVDQK